jgi:5-bromo-4-chloroindolyl phosphate hydrolysis protein
VAQWNRELEDLGRNVQEIIDRAVNSSDYQKLNETIRQTVGRAVDLSSEAVRSAVEKKNSRSAQPKPEPPQTQDLTVLYSKTGNLTAQGLAQVVGGGLLASATLAITVTSMMLSIAGLNLFPPVLTLAGLLGGGMSIFFGVKKLNRISRFKTYKNVLGQKTNCTLEKLARAVGKKVSFVRREVEQMITQGLFREGHLDKEQTMLITSDETFRLFEQSRLQLEERKRQEKLLEEQARSAHRPELLEVLQKGGKFLDEIRRCNDAIPGVEISEKISRMEHIVERIFKRTEQHPEVIPDLKKMMDYYLPMTVKLLNAYADMDAQPVQGETILNSKREIEETLDTLNLAFEKLLDELFQDTALDVSSDITVLKTLLAQEGLTEDEFTRLRRN